MNILIVDDEVQILRGLLNGISWEQLNFDEILTAKNFEQAQAVFREKKIDVLLSDIEMSGKTGLDLILWVNREYPDTQCIILSCHDEFDYARRAVSMNCFDYVLKPVPYEILTEIIDKAVKKIRSCAETEAVEDIEDFLNDEDKVTILEMAKKYIKEHISENLAVETLARTLHISARQLGRIFRKELNQSVSEYIFTQKMLLAGELLKKTSLSVTMVSDKVGYGNYSYFTKQFKKFYGVTPREYQNVGR